MKTAIFNNDKQFLEKVINNQEPELTMFYKQYDNLVWDLSQKWSPSIIALSKGNYDLEDIHNEVWAYILQNVHKCNLDRAGLGSWIYIVVQSKLGMIKRTLESQKNNALKNEIKISLDHKFTEQPSDISELYNFISDNTTIDDDIVFQELLLDFIYLLLELIDSCTDKERKVYLLKIQGKNQNEISEQANVSKSYIPKVYKRLSNKFRYLYDSLDEQCYIDKKERDDLAKDLLSRKSKQYISDKYDLELETVSICTEILDIIEIQY